MTILETLKEIIQEHDRLFYVQRNFNTIAAVAGLLLFVLSLVLFMLPWTSWPWIVMIWTLAAAGYFICRARWFQADSDIIGSALEKFNHAFPVDTNERKIAMNALEDMSSASIAAAMIVALFGGKKSLHYYFGWTDPPVKPAPEILRGTPERPALEKKLKFSGILPLQTKRKIADLQEGQTNDKSIRLVPDRTTRKGS
jgi:hypothetical protein